MTNREHNDERDRRRNVADNGRALIYTTVAIALWSGMHLAAFCLAMVLLAAWVIEQMRPSAAQAIALLAMAAWSAFWLLALLVRLAW